jgi:hypothetical protein
VTPVARAVAPLLAAAAVACARPDSRATTPTPNVVTLTATDYAFAMPDSIPSGLTELRLVNHGAEPHQAVVFRLTEPKPMDTVLAVLAAEGAPPPWLKLAVGPNTAVPHDSSNATSVFVPGDYVVACFISAPDGQFHVVKGMVKAFTVTGAEPAGIIEPAADVTIVLTDYTVTVTPALTAGTHTVRVQNEGPQWHEVGLERLADGKTLADWQTWAAGGMQGEPPAIPAGGAIGPEVGGRAYFTITLTPGKYLLTCYVPDAGDGKPHVLHGMVQEIEVQ